jgi:ketosteroid isomerase-like protein
MSQENVEAWRQLVDALARGDRSAFLALCDADYEVVPVRDWPEAGAIRGCEAAWDFYTRVAEAFEPFEADDAEVIHAEGDKVVVHRGREVRGRASGADVELDYWLVVTFRDGTQCRDEWFTDRSEALEAAGLSE